MLILKITEKGRYVEIPGTLPTRTPAEIDITKCSLSLVDSYMRQNGITKYQILSIDDKEVIIKQPIRMKNVSVNQKNINKRFNELETMVAKLAEKQHGTTPKNSEQITDKLDKLEILTKKILDQKPKIVKQTVQVSNKTKTSRFEDEPKIEELEDKFIPSIDVSKMKIKGTTKKTVKRKEMDPDDSAELLSRIMGQED